jgi:hypothetical protein
VIGSARKEMLTIKELTEYRNLSKHISPDGATWKCYVCPYTQCLLFHHVARNEKIFEADISKKHVQRIVRENLYSVKMMKLRTDLFHDKCKARSLMQTH